MNFKEKILAFMNEEVSKPIAFGELCEMMHIESSMKKEFVKALDELKNEGKVIYTRAKRYGIPEKMNLLVGIVEGNQKGFAFLRPCNKGEKDVFISPADMNGAMHGDKVIARNLKSSSEQESPEGTVIRILERANKIVIGAYHKSHNFGFVVPDDRKISCDIFIPKADSANAKNDMKVVVEITEWPEKRKNPEGKIIEIIGTVNDTQTHIEALLKAKKIRTVFDEEIINEAKRVCVDISEDELNRRKDLRDLCIITIDGSDSKDLDDAVYAEKIGENEFKLGVHIADVAHYVRQNGKVDKEALKRATSIYLPDRVIPMLPKELSNGVCSLNPNEDKLALSVEMIINMDGKVTDFHIFESVIKSSYRLVYEDVSEILENNDKELSEKYKEIIPMLKVMEELSKILRNKRELRGCIDFDFDETKIVVDEKTGKTIDVTKYERRVSNKIIEEFMLACNEAIAENYFWLNMPFVYRIHEDPDEEKMFEFSKLVHNFGYDIKGNSEVHPRELQQLLKKVKGKKEETVINTMMLRSLSKAVYSGQCSSHFGLAAEYYCHFTSPIRRYPDLQIHRIIKGQINGKFTEQEITNLFERTDMVSEQSSRMERVSDEIQRDANKIKIAEYMSDKIGEEYEGIISGVTSFGLFVELESTVEGLIHISNIVDDYYIFDNENKELKGQKNRRTFRIGDVVNVRLDKVVIGKAEIDFALTN